MVITYCSGALTFTITSIDILIGLLRLRKCSENTFRSELTGGVSIVRELHVYPFLFMCMFQMLLKSFLDLLCLVTAVLFQSMLEIL